MDIYQRLMNKVFGWDYIAFCYGDDTATARVLYSHDGLPYIMKHDRMFILNEDTFRLVEAGYGEMYDGRMYLPLTKRLDNNSS